MKRLIIKGFLVVLFTAVIISCGGGGGGGNASNNSEKIVVNYTNENFNNDFYQASLNKSLAESIGALAQAIYTINSFIYTDPTVTDFTTFQKRKAEVDKALDVLIVFSERTTLLADNVSHFKSLAKEMAKFDSTLSAEDINAVINSGDPAKPIATLMNKYNIKARGAKRILDDAMSELSTKYTKKASFWDFAARTADLVKNTAALAFTVGAAYMTGGATALGETAILTGTEAAVFVVTATDACIKVSKSAVELSVGQDIDLDGSNIGSLMSVTSDVSDVVAIKSLFTKPEKAIDLLSNIVTITGKNLDVLQEKKLKFGSHSMEISDEAHDAYVDLIENAAKHAFLPGIYHLADGSTIEVDFVPDFVKKLFEALPVDSKVDSIKNITVNCLASQKVENGVCVNKTCQSDAYNCPLCVTDEVLNFNADGSGYCKLVCSASQKKQGSICIDKTCQADSYNCPTCSGGQVLKYKSDGSGYCAAKLCLPPACCNKAPEVCGNRCMPAGASCCEGGTFCTGGVCIGDGKCCPFETPQSCGTNGCIKEGYNCCASGQGCPQGTVCVEGGGCCPSAFPQRCGNSCILAGAECCNASGAYCPSGKTCTSTGCK